MSNKRFSKLLTVLVCALLVIGTLTGCNNKTNSRGKPTVIATTFAAYDWARNVIGNTNGIDLLYLIDSSVDLHSYQPSAKDIITYKSADLVIAIGGESEEWLENIGLDESKVLNLIEVVEAKKEELVEGMQGEEGEESETDEVEYDEHLWLSLKNAEACVSEIANKLETLDKDNAETYHVNASDYNLRLFDLDTKFQASVNNSVNKTLLFGDRFPFRYLTEDYGLTYYAAFIGCSAETEASFETVAFLANKLKELKLPAVCVISNDIKLAKSIINASETDTPIVVFDSLQSVTKTQAESKYYVDAMINNLNALKLALEGKVQ